jgi:hypothetical protein
MRSAFPLLCPVPQFRVIRLAASWKSPRNYPSGRLTEEDYEFLRDTHGLPRELITELLGDCAETC